MRRVIVGLTVLVAALLVVGQLELALAVASTVPLLVLLLVAKGRNALSQVVLVVGTMLGNLACWSVGRTACELLEVRAARHPLVSLVLLNLLLWGMTAGALLMLRRRRAGAVTTAIELSPEFSRRALWITGLLGTGYFVSRVMTGAMDARGVGSSAAPTGSLAYYLGALGVVPLLLFFFLGSRCSLPLYRGRNALLIFALAAGMVFSSLSGGREDSVRFLLAFLSGSLHTPVGSALARRLLVVLVPFGVAIMVVVGFARDSFSYGNSSLLDRVERLTETSQTIASGDGSVDLLTVAEAFFSRVAEPTGQLVIDRTYSTGSSAGWENADRLLNVFLPRFLVPEKKSLDDGPEVLSRDYDVAITDTTSAPITFLADAFRRGGWAAVLILSAMLGAWLVVLNRLLSRSRGVAWREPIIPILAISSLRLYAPGVLGVASHVTYFFARDALIVALILYPCYRLTKRLAARPGDVVGRQSGLVST